MSVEARREGARPRDPTAGLLGPRRRCPRPRLPPRPTGTRSSSSTPRTLAPGVRHLHGRVPGPRSGTPPRAGPASTPRISTRPSPRAPLPAAPRAWYEAKNGGRRLDVIVAVGTACLDRSRRAHGVGLTCRRVRRRRCTLARIGQPPLDGGHLRPRPSRTARQRWPTPGHPADRAVGERIPTREASSRRPAGAREPPRRIDLDGPRHGRVRRRVATLPDRHHHPLDHALPRRGGQAGSRAMRWLPSRAMPIGPPSA